MHSLEPMRGGRQKLYPVLALPPDVRTRVLNMLASRVAMAMPEPAPASIKTRRDADAVPDHRGAAAARQLGLIKFHEAPEKAKRRAESRHAMVEIAARYVKASGMAKRRGEVDFCNDYCAGKIDVPAWVRAEIKSVSPNSLVNWQKALKTEGLGRLAGRQGLHRVGAGFIDTRPELANFIRAMMAEHPHCSAKHVMRGVRARFVVEDHPNFRTLQRWMAAWRAENAQLLARVSNPDGWRSKFMAAGGNADARITRLNQRWETDSTKGDLLLSDGRRHNIVGFIDVWSRRVKLHVSRTSSATAVASCFRKALLDWGVPEQLGSDNGSDFVSKYMKRVIGGLNIEHDICRPFEPQDKPFIERVFGTFNRDLIELLPGYVGHSVTDRKAIESRRSFAERMMKGTGVNGGDQPVAELSISPEKLQDICDQWVENSYHREIHSTLGCSPAEKAASWTGAVERIENERALDVLLAPAPGAGSGGGEGIRVVGKKGIQLDGQLYDAGELGGWEGKEVRVLLDEADVSEIYVFSVSGPFIAKAICPELSAAVPVSRQEIAAHRKARQKQVMSEGAKALKANAKAQKTADIAFEIMAAQAVEAGKVAFFPSPSQTYTTDALREAAAAARHAAEAPAAPVTAAENVTPLLPTGRPAFHTPEEKITWLAANPGDVTDMDRAWIQRECRRSGFFAEQFADLIKQIEEIGKVTAAG